MEEEKKPTPNRILRTERERRAWSQSQLADEVGTTPLNISRWERGITQPGPHFRRKLCDLFGKTPQQLGLISDQEEHTPAIASTLLPPTERASQEAEPHALWNVAYGRNSFFTGREDILAQLRDALVSSNTGSVALAQPQAISGLGGIGKTQTAVEYAYRFREHYEAVFWARADSYDLLATDFLTIASLLELPQRIEQEQDKIIQAVVRWLDTHRGWLLILDNADDLDLVRNFTPTAGKGHVILTTRVQALGTVAQRIEIEKMGTAEGTLFLLRRIKRIKGDAVPAINTEIYRQAQAIVEAVDGLPLALDQAGAYIEETNCSVADYLKFYKTRRSRLLRVRGKDATGHPEPVATTWALSFEKVEQANPAAAELLKLCAFLHPDSIPEHMISEGAAELGPILGPIAADEFDLNEAIGELHKYSLIKRDAEEKVLNVHRLVQTVLRDGMEEEALQKWIIRTIQMINRIFPIAEQVEMWHKCQQYLPHAQLCIDTTLSWKSVPLELASLLRKTADYLHERTRYVEAEPLYQRALHIQEHMLGPEHPAIAATLNRLGLLYRERGKYAQAEQLCLRSIQMYQQLQLLTSSDLAEAFSNLAIIYYDQGKYKEAEPLHKSALQIMEQTLGPEHPLLGYTLNGLVFLYCDLARYAEAEPLAKRTLHIWEQAHGPEHLQVGYALIGLARVYLDQNRSEEAEPLYIRAIHIWEQVQGPDYPQLGYALQGLVDICREQGRYKEAETYCQRMYSIYEQAYGAEHPQVGYALNGLAHIYRSQGNYEEAEPFYIRTIHVWEQSLGYEAPKLSHPLQALASIYYEQGKYTEATPLFQRALTIGEQALGAEHLSLVDILENYALLLHKTNRAEEATQLVARAQTIRAKQ